MKLLEAIEAGQIPPVVLLYGSEHGPMRQVVEAVRRAVLEPAFAEFNHERFVGRELDGVGRVLDACAQLPVMARLRLVELDEPEAVGKGRGPANPKLLDGLVQYLGAPNPMTVLVVTSTGIDGRSRLVTAAKKTGVVEKFEGLRSSDDAIAFVLDRARTEGIALDRRVAGVLVERCGTSPTALNQALEQAAIHAGADAALSLQDVAAVVADTREAVVFELTDAVGLGRHEQALVVFRRMLAQSSGPGEIMGLVAMLARQLRLLMLTHALGPRELESQVPPFVVRKLREQVRSFSLPRLRGAFAQLVRLDAELKGGSFAASRAPDVAVERWILEACQALPAVAPRG